MKRILIFNASNVIGGAELSLYEFICAVASKPLGHEIFIACSPSSPLTAKLRALTVTLIPTAALSYKRTANPVLLLRYLALTLYLNLKIYRLIKQRRIDVVHANTTSACLQVALAARLARIPIVWHIRDATRPALVGWVLERYADHIIAISDAVRDRVLRSAWHKVSTIYNGIRLSQNDSQDGNHYPTVARPEIPEADLIMVAQYVPWKNHAALIEALPGLKQEMPDIKLLFVGACFHADSSKYMQSLAQRAQEAGLRENVRFADYREDVYDLIRQSKVLVHTALDEPMGRVIVEAMLLKTPVVAIRSGGIPELIDDCIDGMLVAPGDRAGLIEAIKLALRPEVRSALIENAYRKAKQKFAIEQQSRKILNVYDSLLMRRSGTC
jgi:glycosyltransferase involved in cell wall biosynthesis